MGDGGDENDFTEAQVLKMLNRVPSTKNLKRWVSFGQGKFAAVRLNWVTSLGATLCTWVWAINCYVGDDAKQGETRNFFRDGKLWVTQNFSWAYIGTQDVWCAFLIYLIFSRFGSLKLGRDDEKPRYNDFTWFCMLFTCGVAVGLYVYGVAEPLYFYRQPTTWGGLGGFHYDVTKVAVQNDAQRAQQAIFMAVYHWGIHGWVPYILLALLTGIVSFRWGMPMTIRSLFYPLFGDHSLGLLGDLIDALSISTTTFGVCTSLGLGVRQLSSGLQFLVDFSCKPQDKCVEAGGYWNISGYGTSNCYNLDNTATVAHESCQAEFLRTPDSVRDSRIIIIVGITILANLSVLTGLDRGIKFLSQVAFSLGLIVLLVVLFSDNTWYLLSVMVQTAGYYLQYVVQVGFDCEAFQQLDFEFRTDSGLGDYSRSLYWGSQGSQSAIAKLTAVGFDPAKIQSTTGDCGDQPIPCTKGMISADFGAMLAAGGGQAVTASAALLAYNMRQEMIDMATTKYNDLKTNVFGGTAPLGIPCGSGWNTSHYDTFTVRANPNPSVLVATRFCAGLTGAAQTDCMKVWDSPAPSGLPTPRSSSFPACPRSTVTEIPQWGTCSSKPGYLSCATTATYFGDTSPNFMDWWTIFYWAWWITWAPFVGFFVALISRGRTVREVIIGGFICPTLFAILWFSVFGGLAIKMERVAELALQVRPDWEHAAVECGDHYSGGVPVTPESKALAEAGYYMLSCVPRDDQIYRLMGPYANLQAFLHLTLWLGLFIYFLTSSDSGSMVDDIVASSGLSAKHIPVGQKIFWCWTEGTVAIMLTFGAAGSVSSLQAASIILGLPYTLLLCMMVPSLYRALKKEVGDEDIITSYRFNTQLLDVMELFKPNGGSPCDSATHATAILKGLFAPFLGVKTAFSYIYGEKAGMSSALYGFWAQFFWFCWIILHCVEVATINMSVLAWLAYVFMTAIVGFARSEFRAKEKIWGSPVDDFFAALIAWPFVLAQMQMHAETNGKDKPLYFASTDEMIAEMSEFGNGATKKGESKMTSTVAITSAVENAA